MDVFISHSAADSKLAERLTRGLEGKGLSVWFDGHELRPGSDWRHEIEEAIRSAENVVLLIDRQREPDDVQEFTWQAVLEAAWEDERKRLIPVLRRGAELPRFVLSGSSGKAVPVVRLEDARALRGVVETIVELANGKKRGPTFPADQPPQSCAVRTGREAEEPPDPKADRALNAGEDRSADRVKHRLGPGSKKPGEREQRLDEIERYARALK